MKKLVLAMVLVLACSSAAFAVAYSDASITLSGTNAWTNGVLSSSTAIDNTTFKLSTTDTKGNWKANAEFVINNGSDKNGNQVGKPELTYDKDNKINGIGGAVLTLNDVYFQATKMPFTFEVWNWGEDGQGVDYKTPLEWVFSDNAPGANWAARATADVAGQNNVLQIKNDGKKPQYYFFTKRALKEGTSVGAAYKTTFDHNTTLDGWVTTDLGSVVVTGEAAIGNLANVDENKFNFGAKAAFDSNISLYGYVNNVSDKKYAEAVVFNLYRGTYTVELAGDKATIDLKARKSNDQAIGDIFNVDNDFFDINVPGDNDWLKDKGWSAGLNRIAQQNVVVNLGTSGKADWDPGVAHEKNTMTVYAQFAPVDKVNVLAKVAKVTIEDIANVNEIGSTTTEIRGFYKLNDKVNLHPRFLMTKYEETANANEDKDDSTKIGTYISYSITKGMLVGGLFKQATGKTIDKLDTQIEAGYEIAF